MNENTERSNDGIISLLIAVSALLSFILGFVLGVCVTKKLSGKCCKKESSKDFDADEYIRSLNLD